MAIKIRCVYCGTVLGEVETDIDVPSVAYCLTCFAESKKWKEEDTLEILQEWEK